MGEGVLQLAPSRVRVSGRTQPIERRCYVPAFLIDLHNQQTARPPQITRIDEPPGLVHVPQKAYFLTRAGEEHRPEATSLCAAFDGLAGRNLRLNAIQSEVQNAGDGVQDELVAASNR